MSAPGFDAVLESAKRGDPEASAVLFRGLQAPLLRYLRAKAPGDAEDLASEVWVGVTRGLASFVGDEPAFRGWVFTIASRRLRDRGRRRTRRPEVLMPPDSVEAGAVADTAIEAIDRMSAQEAVDRLVAGLPGDMAEVLLLRVVADLPVAEVARLMNKTPGAVRVLQHRALKRAAELMGPLRRERGGVRGA
jgi:RNA polymerase sigma-70 factor (ECF subfamily)